MIIEKIIKKLKNDPDYKWDSEYSSRDLFSVSVQRFIQVIRGILVKPFLKKSAGLLFVGSHVKIRQMELYLVIMFLSQGIPYYFVPVLLHKKAQALQLAMVPALAHALL
jgi:hypothetical protein